MRLGVLGVGSVRCAPEALASVALWAEGGACEIVLFDPNDERLDLMDRFLRVCFGQGPAPLVVATTDLGEACEGVDAVISCLCHDGAARLLSPETLEGPEEEGEEPQSISELGRGDPNRPTPRVRLSRQRRSMGVGRSDAPREAVVAEAMARLVAAAGGRPGLSLVRGWSGAPGWVCRAWPEGLSAEARLGRPHQVLRWTLGDEEVRGFVVAQLESPVTRWLREWGSG